MISRIDWHCLPVSGSELNRTFLIQAQRRVWLSSVKEYKKIDPITQVLDVILREEYATEEDIKVIDKRVKELVAECEKFADQSPYPEKSLMYDVVYEQEDYPFLQHKL